MWNLVSHPREEHGLNVLENRLLRRIFVLNKEEVTVDKENYIIFIICTLQQIVLG
jgi:hypothetical protein